MKVDGSEFRSEDEFFEECTASKKDKKLNIENVLARIYPVGTLRVLAENLGFPLEKFTKKTKSTSEYANYALAKELSRKHSIESIAEELIDLEHDINFSFISYFTFPDIVSLKSKKVLVAHLEEEGYRFKNDKCIVNNGVLNPHGRYPKLESIKRGSTENIVSLIYSCSRILFIPKYKTNSFEDSFLCRIPIVVNFLFDRQLIEVSMPYYYEHFAKKVSATGDYPQRLQEIFEIMNKKLVNLLSSSLGGVDYSNFTLYLESKCGGVDMGWQIEPQDSASFNAKQNVVPLKEIFEDFEITLNRECKALGVDSPFGNIKLYHVFRAIKEEGHTLQLNLKIPLGKKGKKVKFFLIYGEKNSSYPPIIRISDCSKEIMENLRLEMWKSIQVAKIPNPYSLTTLLMNKTEK